MAISIKSERPQIYVLQVLTGKETAVLRDLKIQLASNHASNLSCLNASSTAMATSGDIVFPRREMMQRKNGRYYKKLQPLFPGYLFWLTLHVDQALVNHLGTRPGVMQFLPGRGKMRPLTDDDFNLLQPFLRNEGLTPLVPVEFNEDDSIVIKYGVLSGQEGRIVKVDRRRRRMKVSLSLYGDQRLIDFGYSDLGHSSR